MNNQVTLQDAAKIIDRLGRYFPMLVRNGSEVVNDWYPFIAQFPLDVAQAAAMYVIENTAFDPPKPAVFVQAARMLLQHQTGQRELTAAEAWHAACKQLNPYKKPHYENKLVSQAVSNRWQTTAKISHTWLLYQQTRCPNRTCRLQQTPLRLKSAAYHFRRALQPVV